MRLLLSTLMLFTATQLHAEHSITSSVRANSQGAYITDNFQTNESCTPNEPPAALIPRPPEHGTVGQVTVVERLNMRRLRSTQTSRCEGRPTAIRFIKYPPPPRFSRRGQFRDRMGVSGWQAPYTDLSRARAVNKQTARKSSRRCFVRWCPPFRPCA